MVDHNKMRMELMNGVIKAVSKNGLEGLTTRNIEQACGINDAYIYRYFEDKEDLLKKAFLREDMALISAIKDHYLLIWEEDLDFKSKCYSLWKHCVDYLLSRPDVCRFYVRYYYSTYFKSYALESHLYICNMLIDILHNNYPQCSNIERVLHHILETLLTYCIKITLGEADNTCEYSEIAFNSCYSVIVAYLSPHKNIETSILNEPKLSYLEFYSIVNGWK